ncbi:4-amino-4-deoxychorismate lyase [Actinoplanes lutulentus]|uniref:aminotransferase class IV n=1 Tax=Actinoplanes lutulentus TaxID=1287878 RepID=UPI000DB99E08|nr:aminotransferase class IV [Actinoplanes lutulentus]MBB2945821.1 4-amino-4-deoxychorismate lyase [Actinoplanes lutulentus]
MTERILVSPGDLLGDGVFETLHVRPSGPWLLEEHLARLASSAALLDMPEPPLDEVRAELSRAALALPDISDLSGERDAINAMARVVYTRSGLVHVSVGEIPPAILRERRDGIRVLTAGLGVSIRETPPWSITAAKSLSYASNFAARRWATRHSADDVVWLSTEGYALEAPTASLIWLSDGVIHTVPPAEARILPGITAAHLLSVVSSVGLDAKQQMITAAELADAEAIWLASSVRGLAEVTSLDGTRRPRSPWTPRLLNLLGFSAADAQQPR